MKKLSIFAGQNKLMRPLFFSIIAAFGAIFLLLIYSTSNSVDRYAVGHSPAIAITARFVNAEVIRISSPDETEIYLPRRGKYVIFTSARPKPDYFVMLTARDGGKQIEVKTNTALPEVTYETASRDRPIVRKLPMYEFVVEEPGYYLSTVGSRSGSRMPAQIFLSVVPDLTILNMAALTLLSLLFLGAVALVAEVVYKRRNREQMLANLEDFERSRLRWKAWKE